MINMWQLLSFFFMRMIVGPKKDCYLFELIVNIWSLRWECQLQINFSVQRLELMLYWVSGDGSVMGNICMSCYIFTLYDLLDYLWTCY